MKIAFVAPRFPFPPLQGDRLRAYQFLLRLQREHTVTLITPAVPGHTADAVVERVCTRWVPVTQSRWNTIGQLIQAISGRLPMQTLLFCTPSFKQQVAQVLEHESFDLVHIHTARVAPAAAQAPAAMVIDFIDALSLNMQRRASREQGPLRWLLQLEARRMAAYEQQLLGLFDQQVISSPLDRAVIGNSPRLHVVPNGVALDQFVFYQGQREPQTIIFSGRMGYFPNADAARFFATMVLPLIRRRLPDARFRIVGADPPKNIRALAALPGVEVTGYVQQIEVALQQATIAVAPLRAGSGMQLKVLEAMASGLPLVATHSVVEPLKARAGEHILVADEPEAIAEACVRLLCDPVLRATMAHNARRLVEEHYTWERAAATLEGIYQLAIAGRYSVL